jgi:hypothetical protein
MGTNDDGLSDLWGVPGQGVYKTHGPKLCSGQTCCIHNPSDHHMVDWPMIFNNQRLFLAQRVCEHGVAHSDPDSLRYFANRQDIPDRIVTMLAIHECDGCCLPDNLPERL